MRHQGIAMRPVVGVLVVLACGYARAASAQEISIKGGVNMATISFSPEPGSPTLPGGSWRPGVIAGISFLPRPSNRGGIQIEGLIRQGGVRNLLRVDDAIRLTYLDVPVLLHVDVFRRSRNSVFLVAGPALAVNLQASYEDDGVSEDVKDDIEPIDVAFVAGGGVETGRLTFEARYTWGFRTAFNDGELEGGFRNRSFAIMAGVRIGR
jgi:hypothetical protein